MKKAMPKKQLFQFLFTIDRAKNKQIFLVQDQVDFGLENKTRLTIEMGREREKRHY